jgi:hypothetical protein
MDCNFWVTWSDVNSAASTNSISWFNKSTESTAVLLLLSFTTHPTGRQSSTRNRPTACRTPCVKSALPSKAPMRQCSARTFITGVGFAAVASNDGVSAGPKDETRSANAPLGVPDDALATSCSIVDVFDDDEDAIVGNVAEEEDESVVVAVVKDLDDDGRDSK